MKNNRKSILYLLLIVIANLSGCFSKKSLTITFDTNGGNSINSQIVKHNSNVVKPEDPIKDGYIFEYWCKENVEGCQKYSFEDKVEKSFTLYAQWALHEYTPNLIFTSINNYTEFAVYAANKDIEGEISIPKYFDGKLVTKINSNTFSDCVNLTSVIIPSSITSIEENAFKNTGIWNNSPNNSIIYADKWAIGYKGSLATQNLESNTVGIADKAFYNCKNLIEINIPSSLNAIGNSAFSDCTNLNKINFDSNSNLTLIESGAFYNCTRLNSITLPNKITSLDGSAFYNTGIWNNSPDNNVVYADNWVIGYKGIVTNVSIKANTLGIADSSFYNCSNLSEITIPNSVIIIGVLAFVNCKNLTKVTIDNNSKITLIGGGAFADCDKLTSIVIPSSVTTIGNSAFSGCTNLAEVKFQNNSKLTSINSGVFQNCEKLTSIKIPENVTSINDNAFRNCINLITVEMPNKLITIGYNSFGDCSKIKSISLPNTLKSIGSYAFFNCISLEKINIPDSVIFIGHSAFEDTLIWENATNNTVIYINNWLIGYKGKISSVTFKSGIIGIADSALGWADLTSIRIPNTIKAINDLAFIGNEKLTEVMFENNINITSISNFIFANCINLTSIIIPKSVVSIKESAFQNCSRLTEIIFESNSTLTTIAKGVFAGCINLNLITIPSSVISIGSNAFYQTGIWNNASNNSVVYADKWAIGFKGILTDVTLKSDTVGLADYAFYNCFDLKTIIIPNSVKTIGNSTFFGYTSLESIIIPSSVEYIWFGAFDSWPSSRTIYIQGRNAKPTGWDKLWNFGCLATIVWNY